MIGQTFGHYRIERQLGEGSMGVVYLATDLNQRRQVALKFVNPTVAGDPQFQRRFLQEMRPVAGLDHTGIVRVLDFNVLQGQAYVAQEYITGGNLREYLKFLTQKQRTLGTTEAIRLVQQLAEALDYAHRQGITHLDVKPDNVLLRSSGVQGNNLPQAALADFGVAKLAQDLARGAAAVPRNTFAYMSPEQARGERVDARSDIYSLGVILYELTVNRVPFSPRSLTEAVRILTSEQVTPPSRVRPGIPRDLEQVILKNLAKNPNERFQTAGDMARALQSLQFGATVANALQDGQQRGRSYQTQFAPEPIPVQMPNYSVFPAEPSDVGRARVIYSREGQSPTAVWVTKDVMLIGREADNDLILDSGQVSRNHARLDKGLDGRYRVLDLGSTNGVWLGPNRIAPNTPTEWQPGTVARIGDFWMRLEIVTAPKQTRSPQVAPMLTGAGVVPYDGRSVVPAKSVAEATTDRIGVKPMQDIIPIAAGGRTILTVEITNLGSTTDHFSLEMRGIPSEWFTAPTESVHLNATNKNNLQVTLHPPRNSRSTAGTHNFDVLVRSRNSPDDYASRPGKLQIEPFYGLNTDLHPKRIRGTSAELQITNTGNIRETYSLSASDPDESLDIRTNQTQVTVEPGQTAQEIIRLKPKFRPIIGIAKNMPFTVNIRSMRPDGDQQVQAGDAVIVPLLPAWILSVLGISVMGLVFGLIFLIMRSGADNANNATLTVEAQTRAPIEAQTQGAVDDDDSDGLSNADEEKLGTDPSRSDTDGDGLSDGEEVQRHKTDPLRRDTDNDNLTDGQEVNQRQTNPTNPDTDGDGIPDGADPAPLFTSTPTPDVLQTQTAGAGTVQAGDAAITQTALQGALSTAIAEGTQAMAGLTQTAQVIPTATTAPSPTGTPFPDISVSASALNFAPDLPGGAPGETLSVTIVNNGNGPLLINTINIGGTNADQFQLIGSIPIPLTVAPGASSNISVQFVPTSETPTPKIAELTLVSNDPDTATIKVTLRGEVITPLGALSVTSPNPQPFGSVAIGSNQTEVVTIQNTGNGPLSISGVAVCTSATPPCASGGQFSLVSPPAPTSGTPLTVLPLTSLDITINFAPIGSAGSRSAVLVITHGNPAIVTNVNLNGTAFLPPTANFTFAQVPNTRIVNFTNTTTGDPPLTFVWTFGDGGSTDCTITPSECPNPSHLYLSEGSKTVTLTVIGAMGITTSVSKSFIVAPIPPVANFVAPQVLNTQTINFTSTSTGDITSYSWDFGDGGTSSAQNPSHPYTLKGSKTVVLRVTGPTALTNTITKMVQVYEPPVANFSSSVGFCFLPVCTVTLTSTSSGDGPFLFSWDINNDGIEDGTGASRAFDFFAPTTHQVRLSVSTPNGDTSTILKSVTVP